MSPRALLVALLVGCAPGGRDDDGDGFVVVDDCDDADAAIHPAATEVCDGIDNNCDAVTDVDADDATSWYVDADGDGHGGAIALVACDAPTEAFVTTSDDCDDADASAHPGAEESDCADPVDRNCDGQAPATDADGDGWPGCSDCDDARADIFPGAVEVCDGDDQDCDDQVDEDAADAPLWFVDADHDGWGDAESTEARCDGGESLSARPGDCDDATMTTFPGAVERCDGVDQDCDDQVDEDAADAVSWHRDADGDTFGDADSTVLACTTPAGHVADGTDCDDLRADTYPRAAEACDGRDNDCDGAVPPAELARQYYDADHDGHGDPLRSVNACLDVDGYSPIGDDCDDTDPYIAPGAQEICDGYDSNCDTVVPSDELEVRFEDWDGDGFGDPEVFDLACAADPTWVVDDTDCSDVEPASFPGNPEVCDGVDNDCDGGVDNLPSGATCLIALLPGDLLVTEVMYDPRNVGNDDANEWVEVYNATLEPVEINGLSLRDAQNNVARVRTSVVVPAGGRAVLAVGDGTNWNYDTYGVEADAFYGSSLALNNSGTETLTLLVGDVVLDVTAPFLLGLSGVSWSLAPGAHSATANDVGANWCVATSMIGASGDRGTPGAPKDACP